MNSIYQDLITKVSQELSQKFLTREPNLVERARLFDADIAEITRQIGLETTTMVLEQLRDDLVKKNAPMG